MPKKNKKKALISVYNKENIVKFAQELLEFDYEIISTSGTLKILQKNHIKATPIEKITNFQEILSGRVKTLHPYIHGGLLASRKNKEHIKEIKYFDIDYIDLVVVNFYPFEKVVNKKNSKHVDIIENIDIGGPTMLRSAAKNYEFVTPIIDPNDYPLVINEIKKHNKTLLKTRAKLASKVFQKIAYYDAIIAQYFVKKINSKNYFPEELVLPYKKEKMLRYGENPHQKGMFYKNTFENKNGQLLSSEKLHGKELSFNNIKDANAAINILKEFKNNVIVVGLKHMNPCGCGIDKQDVYKAWQKCYEGDKISIFGGIVATNGTINSQIAQELNKIFLEVIIAFDYTENALKILKKKSKLIILKLNKNYLKENFAKYEINSIIGGILIQEMDQKNVDSCKLSIVTKTKPSKKQMQDLILAQKIVKHVKSNAIVIFKDKQLIGVGAGQMNRIGSAKIALEWCQEKAKGAILASDGFLPFDDVVETSSQFDIKAIIQPGGSINDKKSIDLANKKKISMILTKMRHFKH